MNILRAVAVVVPMGIVGFWLGAWLGWWGPPIGFVLGLVVGAVSAPWVFDD